MGRLLYPNALWWMLGYNGSVAFFRQKMRVEEIPRFRSSGIFFPINAFVGVPVRRRNGYTRYYHSPSYLFHGA